MRLDYFDLSRRAKKQYALVVEPICNAHGLTRNELDVLLFLYNNPEFTRAADIVVHRGMTKSHVSLSVTNLENRGLLLRTDDPEDRRAVHLTLTEPAREIAQQGRQAQERFFGALFAGTTHEERMFWQGLVERVGENILRMEQE